MRKQNFSFFIFHSSFLLFLFLSSAVSAQLWTEGTAYTTPLRQLKTAVFLPMSYGITSTLEVSSQIPANIFVPNVSIKKRWSKMGYSNIKAPRLIIASRHALWYPTMVLNRLEKKGKTYPSLLSQNSGLVVPDGQKAPGILVFTNELLCSTFLKPSDCKGDNFLLTGKLGISVGLKGKPHAKPIYYPVLYPRTSVFQDTALVYAGLDLDAFVNEFIAYSVDCDFLSVGFGVKDWALEHKGMVIISPTEKIKFVVGYKLSFGDNGIGNKKFAISPLVDFLWYFTFKKNEKDRLFQFDMKGAH